MVTPWLDDGDVQLYLGDAAAVLGELSAGAVDCIVTSPPYWALRDYAVAGQIGLEASPAEYVERLVAVFDAAWRVLADVGTLWLNVGDCYASKARGSDLGWDKSRLHNPGRIQKAQAAALRQTGERHRGKEAGLKEKDLVGMPWRIALALQDAGWHLRCDVIWNKPTAMPETVTDRPTRSHEYLFLLTKQPRYHYDAAAISEPTTGNAHSRGRGLNPKAAGVTRSGGIKQNASYSQAMSGLVDRRNRRSVWTIASEQQSEAHFAAFPQKLVEPCILAGCPAGGTVLDPFMGSGTTALVARRLGRRSIGVELSEEYLQIASRRIQQLSLLGPALAPAGDVA